jgi:hypothetical protein
MYICVSDIDFASVLYHFPIGFYNSSDSVGFFLHFIVNFDETYWSLQQICELIFFL